MKEFFSRYYQLVATGTYLVASQFLEVNAYSVSILYSLVAYSSYKEYLWHKGKVLDKDQVIFEHKKEIEELRTQIFDISSKIDIYEKDVTDFRTKLSLATTKSTMTSANAKW